ncbi:MAG: TVP38/TMEM64 family protein [Clostridia bacterium]|nr:TVP38/TMEM64 family protein [Clostridia bacterium]
MKYKKRSNIFNILALLCFAAAVGLVVLLRFFATEEFTLWYRQYITVLDSYEKWIETYGATFIAVAVILLNYLIKSFVPWFPISCLCVASAVIFKWYIAAGINIAGLVIYFTVRFYKGRRHGGGKAERLLEKYDRANEFIENGKAGSKVLLFFSRLLPGVPMGAVSVFYGSTKIHYREYLLVSLLGISYKLFSYITIGRHVFDPASVSFVGPFIPLFVIAGFVLLSVGGAISTAGLIRKIINRKGDKNDKV